jgi:NaMN:DMB phosphoribosyltransferase
MAMHMNGGKFKHVRIISRKSEKTMRKSVSEKAQYGLALLTTEKLIPGETLIGHTGSAYGLYSAMFFEPKKKFGIVVITSGADPGYTNGYNTVIREVVNALYTEVVK